MGEIATVENGTETAKHMMGQYFESNGVDFSSVLAAASGQVKKLRQLDAGKKLTFENGNCLESDDTFTKLTVTVYGELQLHWKTCVLNIT